jgi:hypothetical protein
MAITKEFIAAKFAAARSVVSFATVTIRHENKEYLGTRLPFERGEIVDEAGAIFTVTGGVRLLVSEFAPVWPKAGDAIQAKTAAGPQWITYTIIATRLDEAEATMLMTYGERYDQEGL